MTTKFEDLDFQPHPCTEDGGTGVQAKVFFPNGYGASVIRFKTKRGVGSFGSSYGYSSGHYELAVLRGTKDDWHLCYSTPITDDVLGYLTPEEVTERLSQIEALPARGAATAD